MAWESPCPHGLTDRRPRMLSNRSPQVREATGPDVGVTTLSVQFLLHSCLNCRFPAEPFGLPLSLRKTGEQWGREKNKNECIEWTVVVSLLYSISSFFLLSLSHVSKGLTEDPGKGRVPWDWLPRSRLSPFSETLEPGWWQAVLYKQSLPSLLCRFCIDPFYRFA